jgi:hypothetical protein
VDNPFAGDNHSLRSDKEITRGVCNVTVAFHSVTVDDRVQLPTNALGQLV